MAFPLPVTVAICALLLTPFVLKVSAHGLKFSTPLAPSTSRTPVGSIAVSNADKYQTQLTSRLELRNGPRANSLTHDSRLVQGSGDKFVAGDFSSGSIFQANSVTRLYSYFLNPGSVTSSVASVAAPTISSLSPSSATAGDPGFTLSIVGTNFEVGATVDFGGTNHTADVVFTDAEHLSIAVGASEIATAGTKSVTVTTLGGTSGAADFTVNNPVPSISTLTPASKTKGEAGFTLAIDGSNFVSGATVKFGATDHAGTVNGAGTQVTAAIDASEIASAGTITVKVANVGSADSNGLSFTVNNPTPSISALTPSSATAGGAAFSLSITGTNFVSGATIHFGATDHSATIDDATHVSVPMR